MNVSGPLSISAINASQQHELDLRPFQRVTAQVLAVTGTTALLTIEGYPIVAQLASSDQAVTLVPQQTAQFIVTQRTGEKITLKVLKDDQPQKSLAKSISYGPELAVRLLEGHDIPITANHLMIARAVLGKHLPFTPQLLNELLGTLSVYGSWGSREAELVAALKAGGLPVSAESLALASRQAAQIGDSLARLITRLTDMTGQDLPEALLEQINLNLQVLNAAVLKGGGEPSQIAEQIKAAVELMGRSLENILLEQSRNPNGTRENNLLSLVQLQQVLEQAGKNELAEMIRAFLKDLQADQFLNAKPDPIPGQGKWSEVGFAIKSERQNAHEEFSSARLRVAHESNNDSSKINPAYTRLILQIDVNPYQ
ncbi:MAG: hypothetical protein ACXW4U_04170, partial [Anaerolineales bacterium]